MGALVWSLLWACGGGPEPPPSYLYQPAYDLGDALHVPATPYGPQPGDVFLATAPAAVGPRRPLGGGRGGRAPLGHPVPPLRRADGPAGGRAVHLGHGRNARPPRPHAPARRRGRQGLGAPPLCAADAGTVGPA